MGKTESLKTVFITGGTGSFGSSFASYLLSLSHIKMVRIFSRDEHKQTRMKKLFNKFYPERASFFIGDVRDKERLQDAMLGSDWVVHAAALKQAPLGEIEAQEFIKTNIYGSINVIKSAMHCLVEKTILISSDKAVEPVNLYGATKMCAERLFLQADKMRGDKTTRFACVRYGNVVGTNGSVVPLFQTLTAHEPTPICDTEATRFWLTMDAAHRIVLGALENMAGGEIIIPKLKSVRITDVAEAIRPGKPFVVIGDRPGEKRHEVLQADYGGLRYQSNINEFMTIDEIRESVYAGNTHGMAKIN